MMFNKLNAIALYTIIRHEVVRCLRIWSQTLLPPVIVMSLYYVIFGNFIGSRVGEISGLSYIQFIAPGLVMMSLVTNSYTNVVSSFASTKILKIIEEILTSPVANSVIILGYIAGGIIRGVVVGILVLAVSLFFTHLHFVHFGLMCLVLFLSATMFSLLGFINGVFAKSWDDVSFMPTFVLTPLTYLGGVFYSIHLLPNFWRQVSKLNPILYIVNAFRYALTGVTDVGIVPAFVIIILMIVALFGTCLHLLNRGIGLRG